MNYRKANSDEHNIICKQIKSRSVLTVCLSAPVIPGVVLVACLSVNMMIRQRYDKAVFAISMLMLVFFVIAVAIAMIALMSGFIKRISCINKQNYSVADCVVTGRKLTTNPKHNHSFVTVSFPDGSTQQAMVSSKVYTMAENGKRALLIKYDEPEGKEKLPFEIAVFEIRRAYMDNELTSIDERIQRIVKKMEGFAGKHFKYNCGEFPPVWDKPYPVEKVESFEKEMNIKLPLEYKRFITTFASSGTQPFYGLMPLFGGEDQHQLSKPDARKKFLYTIRKPLNIYKLSKEEYAQIYFDRTINVDQGYVMLTHEGDAMYSILIVNTDDPDTYGTVWFYDLADDAGIYPLKNPANDKPMGFLDWFEYFVDRTLEMDEDNYFSYGELAWEFE